MKPLSLFKDYLTSFITPYQPGKSRHDVSSDKPLFKLSSNENMLGASPLAVEAIKKHIHLLNEYPEYTGGSLEFALSEFYNEVLSPKQFITANSGVGVIELIVHAFLSEGLECIVCNPAFKPYTQFAEKAGAVVRDVPLSGDTFMLDIPKIVEAINEHTRVIWLCSPNNPTGTYIPKAQLESLLDLLPDHVVLVYDEVYQQFASADDYTTALPYVLAGRKVIGINSFSKVYGLAGLRIGFAYTTLEIASYVRLLRRPFLLNTLALEAAKAALKDVDFIERSVQMVHKGKRYLYDALDKLGLRYWKSEGNFIMIKVPVEVSIFEQKMVKEGVMVRPVENFGAPSCVRVTIGTEEASHTFIRGVEKILKR